MSQPGCTAISSPRVSRIRSALRIPRHRAVLVVAVVLAALSVALPAPSEAQTRLLRFPDIHGDRVVFTYAGDLWTASVDGGRATRLTAHPGLELFARFSPDGQWIAFTGQYDGDEQVYVVPSTGGVPRQLTYYPAKGPLPHRWGYDNVVYGWTLDGQELLFRSLRDGRGISDGRLYTVSRDGGLPRALPMPVAGAGTLLPGNRIVYSPLFRDFRNWKRYEGGWAQDLWIFDLETLEGRNFTDHPRTDRDPMWVGDSIYFVSDRTGTLNLYSYDPEADAIEQVTDETVWDVRWPETDGEGRIVYELDGELRILDTGSGESRRIAITVPDDGLYVRPGRVDAGGTIEDFEISPEGNRALFTARGDVFTVPAENGVTRNLTRSSGAHDRAAVWSPDGATIAFVSDGDGEDEIWLAAHDGSSAPRQLTDGSAGGRLFSLQWSPDSSRLGATDSEGRLWVVDVASGERQMVADERHGLFGSFAWSPHGGWIAYTLQEDSGFGSVWLWSRESGDSHRVTEAIFNEFSPAWDPEGNYLYYLSDRQTAPQLGSFEWNYMVDRETWIYALALRRDVPHPFPPRSDEAVVEEDGEAGPGSGAAGGDEEDPGASGAAPGDAAEGGAGSEEAAAAGASTDDAGDDWLEIDLEGLGQRVVRVPVDADNHVGLTAKRGHLLYARTAPGYYGRGGDSPPALMLFSMESREATELVSGVGGYALSADGNKVLVARGGGYRLLDATPSGAGDGEPVSTDDLAVDRVPRQEWQQIFDEVWRRFRDFFYVPNMHGYDWQALRDRYEPLLEHVAHRSDLNYVIGEMIAELDVSHAYIAGGDWRVPERPEVGLPGARFELDEAAGRYRIVRILPGHNEEEKYRSPLTEVGVDVAEGDYVLAIDREDLTGDRNPYELLRHKADRPVTLTVNDTPDPEGAREVTFRPVSSEEKLLYLDWVLANRRRVEEMTGGRVGYLHVPDMGADGIYEFIKWFYGQIRKEGLIVDVRANGGGNVSSMLIERLRRELLAVGFARNDETATTYPQVVFHGHMATIIDENSGSDGDIFPAMFREAGLGPVIGKRSWGGVIGITSYGPLVDGGQVNVPQFGFASTEGEWILENRGVEPDIVVDNPPSAVIAGEDPQLERAVQEVLRRIEEDPKALPAKPEPPVKRDDGGSPGAGGEGGSR